MRGLDVLGSLRDLRKVWRSLALDRRSLGWILVGLAGAFAGVTATFSVVRPVLWQRPPFERIEQLVLIAEESAQEGGIELRSTAAAFVRWRDRGVGSSALAAACTRGFDVRAGDAVHRVTGAVVTSDFFELLGVRPARGRVLTAGDAARGATPVVLSRRLAERLFTPAETAVGSDLVSGAESWTVVGVLAAHQPALPAGVDLWIPSQTPVPLPGGPLSSMEALQLTGADRTYPYLVVVARLGAGAGVSELEGTLAAAAPGTSANAEGDLRVQITPLGEHLIGNLRGPLLALLGAAGLLFVLAVFNASSLLAVRGTSRRRDAAVLLSLGVPRARLAAALVTESLVLSLSALALGLLIAAPLVTAVSPHLEPGLTSFAPVRLDLPVVAFALGLSLSAGGLLGAIAVGALWRSATPAALGDMARTPRPVRAAWGVSTVAQVAVAVVLSSGTALVVQRLHQLDSRDLGMGVEELSVIGLSLSSPITGSAFRESEERLASWPGVTGIARSSEPPLRARPNLVPVSAESQASSQPLMVGWHAVSPSYFATLGLEIEQGRAPTWADAGGTARVAVVSRRVAESFWPDRDPIGRRLTLGDGKEPAWTTVLGVAAEAAHRGLRAPAGPDVYYLLEQNPQRQVYFLIAGSGEHPLDVSAVQRLLAQSLPGTSLVETTTLAATRAGQTDRLRLSSGLLLGFSVSSWLLAGIGLYGLLSLALAQRRREIGVRLALGAGLGSIRTTLCVPGLLRVGAGLAAGVALGLLLSKALGSRVEDLPPLGLTTLGWVTLAVGAFAMSAMAPALRRASRIDAWQELRS